MVALPRTHKSNVRKIDLATNKTVNVSVPKKTRNNGTLYAYIFLHHADILPWQDGKQVHIVSPLTTYMVPKPEEVNLITGESTTQQIEAEKKQTNALDEPVSHWRSRLTLNVMVEDFVFDGSSLPADVHRYMKMVQLGKTVHYLPILFVDQLSNRVKDLMIINHSTTELPLTVSYDKISLGKLRFWIHMQDAVFSLQQFGFSEKDADEIKGIFVDTNLYFLALTFFVAAFHEQLRGGQAKYNYGQKCTFCDLVSPSEMVDNTEESTAEGEAMR
ncbi:LOW QUALITY PROTEIN: lipid scramblase CLPTM1L-like [Macrochelys suwanniensis]